MKKLTLDPKIVTELTQIAQTAPTHQIVQGKGYVYFSIHPTQENITIKEVAKDRNIRCYAIRNFKNSVIGYAVQLMKKPKLNINQFGVAIFYSTQTEYKKVKVVFADQKFRLVSFDSLDYFVSLKWKSNNVVE